jgi:hypothetical protein
MLTLFMRYIALAICTLWLSCGLTLRALAQATSDFKVLPLKTEGVRESGAASVAGDVQSWVRGNGSSRGQFSYRLPINLDDSRAPFFVDVVPVWQQGQGLGVWGQGWEMGTSIKRVNMSQEINFKTDFLQSPWGLLAQGQDGYWYSKDLRQRIRAFVSSEEISAWLPDGTHLEFQTEDSKLKDLVWRLVKATNQRGYVMQFDYEEKGADQSYLSRISWGLDDLAIVNRLSFTYEELPAEQKWTSFLYGGQTRTLDKRIKALHFVNVSGVQEQLRWSYELTYRLSQSSPAFYLSSIQQVFPGGVRRPSLGLEWGDFDADAKKIDITSSQKLKPIIDRIGFARFNQQYLSQHDFNLDGLEDVEIGADNSFFLQTLGGIAANQLREAANGTKLECRKQSNPSNSSRQIVKLGGFKAESLVTFLKTTTSTQTILYLCDLEGRLKQEIRVDGAFGPDPRTRFADLNHDGKPDLIRVLAGSYQISKNLSQDGSYEFGPTSSYPLAKEFDASRGVYIEDINGDGFVDLVSFRASQLVYAPGKGRMQFGPELVRTSILNKDNKTLNFTGFELYFVDANRDGLSDLFGIKSNRFSLFMNVGSRYQEVDLSYLQPKISYTKFLYSDLLGTGLPGLLQAQSDGSVKVLHLTQPQHGLLQKISDGLGNTMDLKWDMAPPMFKAGERPVVLKEALVRSYGDSDQVLVYDYKSPKVSSDGLRFLGFQEMTQNQKHKATKIHYDYSDEVDGIILSEIIRDSRRPDLTFSSLYEYEDQIFSGLHWKALKSKVSGFVQNENGGNISKTETWSDYNDKLCPQKISVTAGEQSEVKSISYWQTPGIWKGMTCFESNVKVQPSIESSIKLEWDIKRDGIGLIKSIEQKTENEDLLLQALEYDADNRIERESYADGRFLNLSYLGKTLVVQKQVDEAGRNVSLPGLSEIVKLPGFRGAIC